MPFILSTPSQFSFASIWNNAFSAPDFPFQFQTDESLYSGAGDGIVQVWNMKTKRISSTLGAHPTHSILWIDFTETGTLLTQGRDGWIKEWSQSETGWIEAGTSFAQESWFQNEHLSYFASKLVM